VNLADTFAFIALPGIGSKLSKRIISFRDKLGGFYSVEQVGETYLLPDSTFQKIKPYLFVSNSSLKRININTASVDEMKAHPYIKYNMANAIFQYRQQHGNYISVEQIKKILIITDEIYQKAAPYLSVK
jgi:competence ComEA-like helix-hairpin-helix protein